MKLKYIITGFISALLMSGCSESFLDVESPTDETIDTYFTTEAHIQEAVVAAYEPLHWPDWAMSEYDPLNIMSDIMADDIWVGGQDKTDNKNWHLMMNYESLPNYVIKGIWTDAYSGVKRCNDVIEYLGWCDDISTENENYYKAQAITLKVFYYNWLWKLWGNIPYFEENLSAPYIADQISADSVYTNMINNLETVISMDAFPMKETAVNYGRITKAVVYMLYAEIVMYQQDESRYSTALSYMEEIINSGNYFLESDFSKIFLESGEWGSGSIYEVIYKDDDAVRSWSNPLYAGGTVLPTLISPYSWADGTDGHDQGWGFCPLRQSTYDMYEDGDNRREATCWNAAAAGDYNKRYQDTGFFLEKYSALTGNNADQKADAQLNWNNNLRIYRYAETLLNAAELLVRTGGSATNASTYLNLVHHRSGLTDDVTPTIDNIIKERHLEFVGEGKRYWDLIRTDKAESTLVTDEFGYRTNTWSSTKKYLPIPQSEIDAANGTLVQNNY